MIVEVDERDIAYTAIGQRGSLVLPAFPHEGFELSVESITPVSLPGEGINYFRVEAVLDEAPLRLRPGMRGVAKIDAGRQRLIWVWTHGAVDYLRVLFWRWTP